MTLLLNDYTARLRDRDVIEGVGLTVGAMQAVARRQLAGSMIVAALIFAMAIPTATRSSHGDSNVPKHYAGAVQQPILTTPPERVVAAAKRETEVP